MVGDGHRGVDGTHRVSGRGKFRHDLVAGARFFVRVDGGVFDGSDHFARGFACTQSRIGEIVERFADEGDAQYDQHDGDAGEYRGPPDAGGHVGYGTVEIIAPFGGRGRFDAEAKEAQTGKGQNGLR